MRPFVMMATFFAALSVAPTHGWAEVRKPFGVAVIIGNRTYQSHDIPEVKFADRDARAIKTAPEFAALREEIRAIVHQNEALRTAAQ